MCIKCDQMSEFPNKLSEDQLMDQHSELILEIAYLAREISQNQQRIAMLSDRCEEIETEMDLREAKNSGSIN